MSGSFETDAPDLAEHLQFDVPLAVLDRSGRRRRRKSLLRDRHVVGEDRVNLVCIQFLVSLEFVLIRFRRRHELLDQAIDVLRDSNAVHRQAEWLNRHHSPSALQLPGQRRAGPRDDEDGSKVAVREFDHLGEKCLFDHPMGRRSRSPVRGCPAVVIALAERTAR